MKKLKLAIVLSLIGLGFNACKKDVPPTLLITVVDDLNNSISGAWIEITVDGANNGVLNPEVIDAKRSDQFGTATFKFSNTVLVDIALYESAGSSVKEDSVSALLKTARSIDDDNVIEKKLVIRTLP